MGYIAAIEARNAEITAQIAALVVERDENDAALRVLARLGFDTNSPAKVSTGNGGINAPLDSAPATGETSRLSDGSGTVASNSAASTQELHRPMEGAADSGEATTGLAANHSPDAGKMAPDTAPPAYPYVAPDGTDLSGDVRVADQSALAPSQGDAREAGEVGPETVGASPATVLPDRLAPNDIVTVDGDPNVYVVSDPDDAERLATGKPAGERSSAAPSLLSRVRAYMSANPDSTARECADALGVDVVKVRNTARGVIVFAPTRSPLHRLADQKAAQRGDASDGQSVVDEQEPPPASAPSPAIAFVPPPGEMSERTAKRIEVAALHQREPWLTPEEAAARLMIPVGNLRIFTMELEIEWSRPRETAHPAAAPTMPEPRTLRDRVISMHKMHPTWGAGMISKELGCAYGSASTYLAEARRVSKEQPPAPINREVA